MEYNRATVRVARIDHEISLSELQRQVESHLLEVSRAYWSLYLERGLLAIKTRLAGETGKLLETLRARRRIDALESQIVQARAALAAREADTVRAAAAVRNAEARIVALVNDPALRMSDAAEIVPTTSPSLAARPVDVREAARHALEQRPEIDQAVNQLRAGMVRLKMSENELRPVLDLVFGATWDGLEGDFSYGRSLRTQVTEGGPGLSAGLILDVPLGNRTARARHERRRLEVRQLTSQLAATVETLMLEVQVSTREVQTAHRELTARYHEMQARAEQLASIESRGALSAAAGRPMSTVLDDLLDAQEDRAEAEQSFLRAVVTFNVAIANLDRAMGVLLQARGLEPVRGMGDGELPTLQFAPRG